MTHQDYARFGELKMVMHMIYEFKKGIRNLVLCTLCPTCAEIVKKRLDNQGIRYVEQSTGRRTNLFFGKSECLDAISCFVHKPLNRLTPEEDFMLGAMLGYDLTQQAKRYCDRRNKITKMVS